MVDFQIDLLDVGAIEYGDSILIQAGGLTALVDGGKSASAGPTKSQVLGETVQHTPLDKQIADLLGRSEVDLLVVTHCHSDHIGCLPRLFAEGRLSCKFALVADVALGYGISDSDNLILDNTAHNKLRLALREEPITSTDDAQIAAFIEDSVREYSDSPGLGEILAVMQPMGLKIYGPTATQLVWCAESLKGRSEDNLDPIAEALRKNNGNLAAAYRALQFIPSDSGLAEDGEGANGSAVNNQSIVLSVGDAAHRALLTGDMQFVKPQVSGSEVKAEMHSLVDAIVADAPFEFVKLSHHGAGNGQNLDFLRKLGAARFAISTGSRSGKHPTGDTLRALSTLAQQTSAHWVRVDINGRCGFKSVNGKGMLYVTRNEQDDKTPAGERAGDAVNIPAPAAVVESRPLSMSPLATTETASTEGTGVEVLLRIPRGVSKVSLTVEVTNSPLA